MSSFIDNSNIYAPNFAACSQKVNIYVIYLSDCCYSYHL